MFTGRIAGHLQTTADAHHLPSTSPTMEAGTFKEFRDHHEIQVHVLMNFTSAAAAAVAVRVAAFISGWLLAFRYRVLPVFPHNAEVVLLQTRRSWRSSDTKIGQIFVEALSSAHLRLQKLLSLGWFFVKSTGNPCFNDPS